VPAFYNIKNVSGLEYVITTVLPNGEVHESHFPPGDTLWGLKAERVQDFQEGIDLGLFEIYPSDGCPYTDWVTEGF